MKNLNVDDFENAEELFEQAPCAYISALVDGTIIKANETFCKWTGYSKSELITKTKLQNLFTTGCKIFYETHVSPLLQMQSFVKEVQLDLLRKNGKQLPTLFNAVIRKTEMDQPFSMRVTLYDITDRKSFEKELILAKKRAEKAAQAKSEFISMLSHEIRTPMNAIIGIANLFESTDLSGRQKEYLKTLKFSSEHLLGLINDILDFSKIEAGRAVLIEKSFNLQELIQSIALALKVKADEKKIGLDVSVDPDIPTFLKADPLKIGQVLTNLLGNAIKFTSEGRVGITVSLKQKFARSVSLDFKIRDTGIGISDDKLNSIFEEFVQADQEVSLTYGGTGLGLAISQKLVELYGSRIQVQSQIGKGSEFSFNLLLKVGDTPEEALSLHEMKDSMPKKQAFHGLRALVVEDNNVNVFVLSRFLEGWGVEYEVASNGHEGLQKAQQKNFDLILMDIRMPVMSGFQATQEIRNLHDSYFQKVPIIALSASTKVGLTDHLSGVPFTDFVGKPFRPEELFQKIALHCQESLQGKSQPQAAFAQLTPRIEDTKAQFTVAKYREALGDDKDALQEVLSLIMESYQIMKVDIAEAIRSQDLQKIGNLAHKIKVSTQMLRAERLEKLFENLKADFDSSALPAEKIDVHIQIIQTELDHLIKLLNLEISNL
jgi:PAS domain S-box-containing protein